MEKIEISSKLEYIAFVVMLFLYIFNPPFFSVSTQVLIDCVAIGIVIFDIIHKGTIEIKKSDFIVLSFFVPFLLYVSFSLLAHILFGQGYYDAYLKTYSLIIKFFLRTVFITSFFILLKNRWNISKKAALDGLVWAGVGQLGFVLLALFVRPIRLAIANMIRMNGSQSVAEKILNLRVRSYGLAENLFDSFGYVCSFIITLTFLMGIEEGKTKKIVLSLIMIIMPILNSRTGVLFALIGYGIGALLCTKKVRSLKILMRSLIAIVLILLIVMSIPTGMIPIETLKWVKNGGVEIGRLLLNQKVTGTFANIRREIRWPSSIMFGEGAAPEYLGHGNIDMGYCQCIWRYGLIGTMLLVLAFVGVFLYCYKVIAEKNMRIYVICVAVFFFAYMYKLYSLNNMGANFIIFYSLSIMNGAVYSDQYSKEYELEAC